MYAWMKRMKKDEKGFTLIELLAVIIIIGIIAAIAVPTIGGLLTKTKDDADKATAQQLYEAARLYITAELGGDFKTNNSVTLETLQNKNYFNTTVKLASTGKALDAENSKVEFDAATGKLSKVILSDGSTTPKELTAQDLGL